MTDIYGTVEGYKTYHSERGNTFVDDDTAILIALVRGSEYIDNSYRTGFPGDKTERREQEREWPRISLPGSPVWDIYENSIPDDVVPVEVIYSTYEAALREQATPGALEPDVRASDRRKSVRVDGAVAVTYADIQASDIDAYRLMVSKIDGIIAPVLTGGQDGGNFASFAGKGYRI